MDLICVSDSLQIRKPSKGSVKQQFVDAILPEKSNLGILVVVLEVESSALGLILKS